MYYEEPDLSRRIKNIGDGKIRYDKRKKMIHLEKKSTPNTLNSVKYEFESAIYYGKKYNLDYKSKIRFEYRYLLLKKHIYKRINKEKYNNISAVCRYLKSLYFDEGII